MFVNKCFSIGPEIRIYFSPGNLQYNTITHVWRFAQNQRNYIGISNSSPNGLDGWIDLFGWGTGTNPTERSHKSKDYKSPFQDWGCNLPHNNGDKWFTLSLKQWEYLLTEREDAENKCALADIDGQRGLIILPDQISIPKELNFQGRIDDYEEYEGTLNYYCLHTNCYTENQWNILENLGAVFIPFGGQRYRDLVRYCESTGWYWTCDQINEKKGGNILIRVDGSYDIDSYFSSYGCSVRLVRNTQISDRNLTRNQNCKAKNVMRARVLSIFNDKNSQLRYSYVNTAKFRDDVEAVYHNEIRVPMMAVRVYNEDDSLGEETVMYASPEIVENYTQINFFQLLRNTIESYEFNIRTSALGYSWEIEFEMVRGEYPYLNLLVDCDYRDRLLPPVVDFPKIIRIYKCEHHW